MGARPRVLSGRRRPARVGACLLGLCLAGAALSQPLSRLPAEVEAALRRARLPDDALSAVVLPLDGTERRLAWNAQQPVNPASVFKLVTTQAALDLLGPAWAWRTQLLSAAPLRDGVLDGPLLLRAQGDPKLVVERLWLLLRRLRQQGVRELRGDWLLDRSAFHLPGDAAPGDFDGDASRPYNVRPDALLLNHKAVIYTFTPDPARGVAQVGAEPALAGVTVPSTVALAAGPCEDWRGALQADWSDPLRPRWAGVYPAACGERSWPVAPPEPERYNARLLEQLWRELGGQFTGRVRDATPEEARAAGGPGWRLLAESPSPPLAEVVRDINKFSNNVMAEQLFLSLPGAVRGLRPAAVAAAAASAADSALPAISTRDEARTLLRRWLTDRLGEAMLAGVVVDNGSGLSREQRVTAQMLARLLQQAWSSPTMPELVSSLPVSGLDGTLRRSTATAGRAHLKTGSLRDVAAVAGYVLSDSGRRWLVVGILHHPQAQSGRPVLDALVQWTIRDAPAR